MGIRNERGGQREGGWVQGEQAGKRLRGLQRKVVQGKEGKLVKGKEAGERLCKGLVRKRAG